MKRNLIKMIMGLVVGVVFGLAGCGGGGGNGSDSTTTTSPKVSAIDGTWKLTSTSKPLYLGNYNTLKFSDGALMCDDGWTGAGSLNKTGTFTLQNNTLTYTMTKAWASSSDPIRDLANMLSNPDANKITPPEIGSAVVTINGDNLTWSNSSGSTIATFRRYPATASGVPSIVDGMWHQASGFSNTQLGVFEDVELTNGKIFTDNNWRGNSKSGTFTVTGNTLSYIFDTINFAPISYTQNNTVTVSVSGNTMLWSDSSGSVLATFTK